MATQDTDDRDDRRNGSWLLLLLLLLLLIGGFFGWRWWTGERQVEQPPQPTQDVVVEDAAPEPVVAAPEPEPEPEPVIEAFQEPLPIEEPPPPSPEAVSFTVYFELMKANLTEAAAAEIDARLADIDATIVTGVSIDGYTDTAGADFYNQSLSERRAQVVREYLIDRGMAASAITTRGNGETGLARATADGVREPLNRRAEISIHFD